MAPTTLSAYRKGINLGGWLSQYGDAGEGHFARFITEADIRRIADWGMDHVRLPVDCTVLEERDAPHGFIEAGFARIDDCIAWCERAGLNLILDLHKAPGYSFDNLAANELFRSPALQARMLRIWKTLATRYADRYPRMVFELMNEVVLPDSGPWNTLIHEIVPAIHAIDPKRLVMVGGNHYNAVHELANLRRFDDPRVLYTFHFYEPLPFTHQGAHWVPELVAYGQVLDYPGPMEGLGAFLAGNPAARERLGAFKDMTGDRKELRTLLLPALEFMQAHKVPLYCGEFGVIETAPAGSRRRWHADIVDLFNEYGIGRAVWSYKEMDFGLVDARGKVRDPELVSIIARG